ncbi:metallophosphoesterase [Thermodesulfobacteriota bacterium]
MTPYTDDTGIVTKLISWSLLLAVIAILGAIPTGCVLPPEREAQDLLPYLQMPTTTSMTIQWRTCTEKDGLVRYGIFPSLEMEIYDPKPVQWHGFTLTGLLPDTEYVYTVYSNGEPAGGIGTFRTAPEEPVPFVFDVIGDTLYSPTEKLMLIDRMVEDDPSLVLHLGDFVGEIAGYSESLWREHFFEDFGELISQVPLMPVLGNHDYQGLVVVWFPLPGGTQVYRDYFTLPNNERWYSFDWGNCHFIALDTNLDFELHAGEQLDWLTTDLKQASDGLDDPDWIFAYFHHPAFCSGFGQFDAPGQPLRDNVIPLLEAHGVDLVFFGHDHFYERLRKDGVHYILSGGGGASPAPIIPGSTPHSQVAMHAYQYVRVSVDGEALRMESIDENGTVIDSLSLP